MTYHAAENRYEQMQYRTCGRSGLKLPLLSLGLWHNFGDSTSLAVQRDMLRTAFDLGITHFDLANNYGPPYGSAESNFGKLLRDDFLPYRDELIISTKAGWDMWPGPYGQGGGSRKYVLASLDQSLKRMGLDYVDIFYSHRFDPDTPLEETMGALATAVQQGKALYVGLSSYSPQKTAEAAALLRDWKVPCLIHQPSYNMLNRWIEDDGLLDTLEQEGMGCITFTALAQGPAERQIPGRRAAGCAHQPPRRRLDDQGTPERGKPGPGARPEPDRSSARPEPGADGAGLGAARPARHHDPDRREQQRADPRKRGGAAAAGLYARRAARHRCAGARRAYQSVGRAVEGQIKK